MTNEELLRADINKLREEKAQLETNLDAVHERIDELQSTIDLQDATIERLRVALKLTQESEADLARQVTDYRLAFVGKAGR